MKLKKSSVDIQNHIPMCESMIKVIDFDKIPKDYSRGRGWPGGKKLYPSNGTGRKRSPIKITEPST